MTLATGRSILQSDPPRSPRETLPTMYDLPSEFPEEPGLPDVGASPSRDVFHDLQPQLLSRTLFLRDYDRGNWFSGSDLNVYYDVHHPLWHKRPDWFLALGVPRLYDDQDLRLSYVVWQEGVAPTVVVELLSPSTEAADLGRFYLGPPSQAPAAVAAQPPDKFTVYERYLKVPHYITYSRHRQELRYFQLVGTVYQEQTLNDSPPALWLPDLSIGLGIWTGEFEGIERPWLRWCDRLGNWILTDTEQERQAKEQALQRAEQLAQRLRDLGIDPES
jgi:Uma2 family endonuclease